MIEGVRSREFRRLLYEVRSVSTLCQAITAIRIVGLRLLSVQLRFTGRFVVQAYRVCRVTRCPAARERSGEFLQYVTVRTCLLIRNTRLLNVVRHLSRRTITEDRAILQVRGLYASTALVRLVSSRQSTTLVLRRRLDNRQLTRCCLSAVRSLILDACLLYQHERHRRQ